jgi:GMP synthase-like glutamine amidotransferase
MKILVFMHIENEGPGTLGDYLVAKNVTPRICRLFDAEPLPGDASGFDAIVSMGGPMSVYEEAKYPFLKEETLFLRRAIDSGVPVLGICLGAQMIAKACGAAVRKAPEGELGWARVRLTPAARTDPLFHGVSETLQVFQWHDDTFDIPKGGLHLATSQECPNQAFRYRNAYGLQFHVEVTPEMLKSWSQDPEQQRRMVDAYEDHKSELVTNARTLYANFLARIWERQANRA